MISATLLQHLEHGEGEDGRDGPDESLAAGTGVVREEFGGEKVGDCLDPQLEAEHLQQVHVITRTDKLPPSTQVESGSKLAWPSFGHPFLRLSVTVFQPHRAGLGAWISLN